MEYRRLGDTGVQVSVYALGSMMFGSRGNQDVEECTGMVHSALDAGVNLIDTADVYSAGEAEQIIGRAIRGRRDDIILATKFWGAMGDGVNDRGASRLWILRAVEGSLKRLGTDHIDIYQIHRPDNDADLEDTLGALTDLVRQGKIRYFGSSTFPAWQLVEAHWTSERRGLGRLRSEQAPYSIFAREAENAVFPVAQRYGMGMLVWSPLSGGWLTGKYRPGSPVEQDSRAARAAEWRGISPQIAERFDFERDGNKRKLALVAQLARIADELGSPLAHVAMAFSIAHPAVTTAILGPRTPEQLRGLLDGVNLRLGHDVLDAIDALVVPGSVVEESDRGWSPPSLAVQARRRPFVGVG